MLPTIAVSIFLIVYHWNDLSRSVGVYNPYHHTVAIPATRHMMQPHVCKCLQSSVC